MNRRSFLKAILATGVAPYVVLSSGVLMPVRKVWTPEPWQEDVARWCNSEIYKVTSLDPGNFPGTLRHAITDSRTYGRKRTIIFEVGGVIQQREPITL